MARLIYADAVVKTPKLNNHKEWNKVRHASKSIIPVADILADFSPDKYLLTHATIVASVDVEPNGYYIKPESSKYVNQNGDCWERSLLLRTFRTFIGAQNYLEHVQIPHLSKGRIIDAVARPVNNDESVYIDILVATERKHRTLVADIENGKLSTLSMGCSIKYSFCSKCGNKAEDEMNLCDCIRFLKGCYFIDEEGKKRIIAELCGEKDDPESNIFIEASWVENPAFKGAVLRNIILAQGQNVSDIAHQIEEAYSARKAQIDPLSIDGFLKAASATQLSDLERKVLALKQARTILSNAGLEWDHALEEAEKSEDEDSKDANGASDGSDKNDPLLQEFNNHLEDGGPDSQENLSLDPIDTMPIDQIPDDGVSPQEGTADQVQSTPDQQQASSTTQDVAVPADSTAHAAPQIDAPPADQTDQGASAQPQDAGAQPMGEQVAPQPQDPGMTGGSGLEPQSFEDVVDQIKKQVRQQIVDDLQNELTEHMMNGVSDFTNSDKENQDVSQNDNLVTAFINIYKDSTGFSKSKLASLYRMLESYEKKSDFVSLAYNTSDLIDFFQFVDTFQLSDTGLSPEHYNLLRKAGRSDVSDLNQFIYFTETNGITDKSVIKALISKVSFIREFLKRRTDA